MIYPRTSPILASRVGKPIPTALAAWYRYNTGITSAGGTVSAWANQTGGEALVQATPGNRPTLESDGTILFNGVDQFLKTAPFTLNQPTTVYFLGRAITWTNNDVFFDGNTNGSGKVDQRTSSPNLRLFAGTTGFTENTAMTLGTYFPVAAVINGASSLLQVGSQTQTGNAGANNMGGFKLGVNGDEITGWSNIQVKEVLIYNVAHDANQRAAVIAYLNMVNQL
jgi:hypothetical protein